MSLPQNVRSDVPVPTDFVPPRNYKRNLPEHGYIDYHLGPIAIADPTQGLSYQLWTATLRDNWVYLKPANAPEIQFLDVGPGITWISLAFNQNGRPFIGYSDGVTAKFYWYDTTIPGFTTTTVSGTVERIFSSIDDLRPLNIPNSDIIVAYKRSGHLFYRQERDRFNTEYDLGEVLIYPLAQLGMNLQLRLQFLFRGP